jgi:hypothetical protein
VAEKYCYNDNPINCTNYGGLYQWDKLMLFDETPANQGFCPPGWHIPTENDWNTLFANYINNAFAGSPLKYSGYSGFNALLSGARYINKAWEFQNFATVLAGECIQCAVFERLADGLLRRFAPRNDNGDDGQKEIVSSLRASQCQGGSRKKKIELINKSNKNWDDLYFSL